MRLAVLAATSAALTLAAAPAAAQPGQTPPSSPGTWQPAPPPPAYPPGPYAPGPYAPGPYAPAPYAAPYGQPAYAQPPRADVKVKDPGTATLWALGTSALALGAFVVAVEDDNPGLGYASLALGVVGPSAGHIYAGEGGHAIMMSLLRGAGVTLFVVGAVESDDYACYDTYYCEDTSNGEGKMLLGAAMAIGGTLYDFYDASRAARRANAKAARVMVAPTMYGGANGPSPGFALTGSF